MFHTRQIKRLYGLSAEQYQEMFVRQGGRCQICERHQSELNTRLAVDHNHATGRVRRLLCLQCNTGLGWFELRREQFEDYLEEFDG